MIGGRPPAPDVVLMSEEELRRARRITRDKARERRLQLAELLGGLIVVAGLAMIHPAMGVITLGALLILAANFTGVFGESEADDADSE